MRHFCRRPTICMHHSSGNAAHSCFHCLGDVLLRVGDLQANNEYVQNMIMFYEGFRRRILQVMSQRSC